MSDYERIRKRIENYKGKGITDLQIIEEQEKEIKYYRNKIEKLENVIHNRKKEVFDRKLEININDEEYLIEYNNDADIVMLNTYIVKLVNEKDQYRISKDYEFNIINKTRYNNSKYKYEKEELRWTIFDRC